MKAGRQLIDGPAGTLEVQVDAAGETPRRGGDAALICHPHPLYGGSYNNKVVYMLARAFNELGADAVRFNFRGVGRSEGEYDEGRGETEDAAAVLRWLRERLQPRAVWLAGFSFGAFVATRLAHQAEVHSLMLVAPPVSLYGMDEYRQIDIPWLVLQGGRDEVVSPQAVKDWVAAQKQAPEFIWFEEAEHFFHGRLNDLRKAVVDHWKKSA